jgi:hypothetical protein
MSFQRSTMYLVERRLKEITGDAAYFSPPPSPYPGYPTEGGIVTPASPSGDAGSEKIDISWEYPQSVLSGASFGGFVVLRSGDAGDNWVKASTGEAILTAQNPLAPDTAVPSFTDTTVAASTGYVYKVAAVDVSGAAPVLTEYSAETTTLTPTAPGGADFTDAYDGLGLNIPKIVDSVDHYNGYAKNIATLASGASTTATVTITGGHGMTTGSGEVYVVHIKGVTGANSGDVPDGYYAATYATSTTFTITKTGTNSLSLSGGIATIYRVGGGFLVETVSYTLTGTPGSVETQYPLGQLVYAENDGKLYRNGKVGTNLFDYYWTRAAVDAIDVSADGQVSISADRLTAGTIDAGIINVTNLNASNITSGTINASVIGVTNLNASNITTGTLTASLISGGTLNANLITVTNLSADSIDAGTLTLNGLNSTAISGTNFTLTNTGLITATGATLNNLIVDNSGTKPSILANNNNTYGEFAVNAGTAFRVGHWNGSQLTARFGFTNTGTFQIFDGTEGASPSVAAQITSSGRATIDIQDGVNFYDGTTNRGRLRASTATSRIVSEVPFNVDGLLTAADGMNMSAGNMTLTITNNATSSQSETMRITTSTSHPLGINRLVFRGTSSRDYKTEISPLPDSDEILNNQPVTFHDKFSREVLGENSVLQIGMIAEDFSETGPISDFYTVRDESDKITGIQYDLLSTALISAGRSLRSRIEALEARVAELEAAD